MNIKQYKAARYPFLWLSTTEEERTIRSHRAQLKNDVRIFSWDIAQGFCELAPNGSPGKWTWKALEDEPTQNPGEALLQTTNAYPENSVFYMKDYHKFFEDITVIRKALNIKETLKATARTICFLSCQGQMTIPPELKNDITPFNPPLPTREELAETVKRIASDNNLPEPKNGDLEIFANALIGLTEEAAENALALCLVQNKRFDAKTLLREKSRLIEATAGLTYQEYSERLEDLRGLQTLINYAMKAAPNPSSSSILLYGIPGTGKSHFSKAMGNALQWPVIGFNLSNIRTKFQGETEGNLEKALATIDAIGRAIVFCDEIDKSIAGSQGGADSDGGTGARIIGRLLQYFEDRKPGGAYWIMTANSLQDILTISGGALVRRFDAMFFLDMPTQTERTQIIEVWNKKFNVQIPPTFDTDGMTGADIKKLAKTMDLLTCTAEEARKYVIPTKQALGARIDEIRKAATATCIPATPPPEAATKRKLEM